MAEAGRDRKLIREAPTPLRAGITRVDEVLGPDVVDFVQGSPELALEIV